MQQIQFIKVRYFHVHPSKLISVRAFKGEVRVLIFFLCYFLLNIKNILG